MKNSRKGANGGALMGQELRRRDDAAAASHKAAAHSATDVPAPTANKVNGATYGAAAAAEGAKLMRLP
jgi:hypothetical protein